MNSFKSFHPIVNFTYFVSVIIFSMFFMHPACLIISVAGGFLYSIKLNGMKAVKFNFLYMLPVMLITAVFNPLFNHEGATIISYMRSGNPLTLESICYGVAAGAMLVSVICWFSCYNAVMTSDKFIYIFGRSIPYLSLILSMVLRLVPKLKAQLKVVTHAQKCVGKDIKSGNCIVRLKNSINILSIMITWALEDAIDTADSMKSRGYGLEGRTAFSIYKWHKEDRLVLGCILALIIYILFGYYTGHIYFSYFPILKGKEISLLQLSFFLDYILLCNLPIMIEIWEGHKWKATSSRI